MIASELILNSSFYPLRRPSLLLLLYNIPMFDVILPTLCLNFSKENFGALLCAPNLSFCPEIHLLVASSHHWTMSCAGICLIPFSPPCWKCPHLGSWFFNKCHVSSYLFIVSHLFYQVSSFYPLASVSYHYIRWGISFLKIYSITALCSEH